MAFTSVIGYSGETGQVVGRMGERWHFGTYQNTDGSTGGDINTGLSMCHFIKLTTSGASASASVPVVNEEFSLGGIPGSAITIVTAANASGYWWAAGY